MAASQPLAEAPAAWEKPAEWLFTIAFTAEALIKVGAMGFAWESRNAYVWDVWNLLDLVAIVSAWVSLLPLGAGNYAVLRSVRILRPLRTVQRIKGMRILIGSLAASLPALLDVAMLFGFLILVFGVVGVEMFAGRLHYRCVDPTGEETGDLCTCPGATTLAIERRAPEAVCPDMCAAGATCKYLDENPEGGAFSFDWILPALSDIFMCITLEGWTDLMYLLQQPAPAVSVVFFILLVFFGSFFVFNLVLVVVAENYLKVRDRTDEEMRKQRQREREEAACLAAQSGGVRARPPLADRVAGAVNRWWRETVTRLRRCYDGWPALRRVTDHPHFGQLMVLIILLNTLAMAMDAYGSKVTEDYRHALQISNYVFTGLFVLEMAIKLTAEGPVRYFWDPFNTFDAIVVALSVLEILLTIFGGGLINLSPLRTLRLARAFKLARSFQGLRRIINTLIACMTQARDLALLLLLLIFIFALLGMEIFGGSIGACDLTCSPYDEVPLGDYRNLRDGCLSAGGVWEASADNFDGILSAMMSVFVVFVGENWNALWIDAFRDHGYAATAFFIAAVLVGNFMVLNLFVAILVANYDSGDSEPAVDSSTVGDSKEGRGSGRTSPHGGSIPRHQPSGGVAMQIHEAREREAKKARANEEHLQRQHAVDAGSRLDIAHEGHKGASSVAQTNGAGERRAPSSLQITLPPDGGARGDAAGRALGVTTSRWNSLSRPRQMWSAQSHDPATMRGWDVVFDTYRMGELASPKAPGSSRDPAESALVFREAMAPGEGPLCLPSSSPLHRFCLWLVLRPEFEALIIALILVSSVSLALDDPARPESEMARALFIVDIVCTALFTAEMALKIVGFGLYRPKHGYLRSHWNKLDALVVVISILSIVLVVVDTGDSDIGFVNALRALRVLRPLRLVNRFKGMRTVLLAIFNTLPECLDVMAVALFFNLIFAIVGVQQFGGRLGWCIDAATATNGSASSMGAPTDGSSVSAVVCLAGNANGTLASIPEPYTQNQTACLAAGQLWVNPVIGDFDNTVNAMLVLFEMLTAEMWPDYLHLLTDAYEPFEAPRPEWSSGFARIYAGLFIVVGTLFLGNLIIGILIDNFDKLRGDERGRGLLTREQMEWVAVQLAIVESRARRRPRRPNADRHRALVYDVVMHPRFVRTISVLIFVNALLLAAAHYQMSPVLAQTLDALNYFFATVYVLEAALKIYGLHWRSYFSFPWNAFDFCLALLSLIDVGLSVVDIFLDDVPKGLTVTLGYLRLLRLLRLVRVIQSISALRLLLASLFKSLPSLVSVGSLLLLLLFMYAVLGVQAFYNVQHGEFLNEAANFRRVPIAMLTLFRATTGESWNGIMHDLQTRQDGVTWVTQLTGNPPRAPPAWPSCADTPEGCRYCSYADGNCGGWYAIPYFLSFSFFSFFLLLNAVIAVLLEHFSEMESSSMLPPAVLDTFIHEWAKLDPSANRYTEATNLVVLLRKLPPPLGIDRSQPNALLEILHSLCAPNNRLFVHKGQHIFFHETLMTLARRNIELPIEGLGYSRFAMQHRAYVRASMRVYGQPGVRLYSTPSFVRSPFSPHREGSRPLRRRESSSSSLLRMENITIMDVWAAQLLQARWKGCRVRRIYLLSRASQRVSQRAGGDARVGPPLMPGKIGSSQLLLSNARSQEICATEQEGGGQLAKKPATPRGNDVLATAMLRLPRLPPDVARTAAMAETLLPSSFICSVSVPRLPTVNDSPDATGVFVVDHNGHFPCRWVPCEPIGTCQQRGSLSEEGLRVRYTLASAGGKPLSKLDVLDDPPRVLRLLAAYRAALVGHCACSALASGTEASHSRASLRGLPAELDVELRQLRVDHMERNLSELEDERASLLAPRGSSAPGSKESRLAELEEDVAKILRRLNVQRRVLDAARSSMAHRSTGASLEIAHSSDVHVELERSSPRPASFLPHQSPRAHEDRPTQVRQHLTPNEAQTLHHQLEC